MNGTSRGAARPAGSGGQRPAPRPGGAAAKKPPPPDKTREALPRAGKIRGVAYKADIGKRIAAAGADLLVGSLPAAALFLQAGPWVSILLLVAYLLVRDGLPIAALDHASVGKKLLGLHVEIEATGADRLDPGSSLKRNLTLVAGLLPLPLLWGLSPLIAVPVAAAPPILELAVLLKDANGLRLGDRLAGTKVLD